MKKITLLFLTVFSVMGSRAADEFVGKVVTLNKATSISTEQWYALYNSSSGVFLCDDGSGTLTTSTTPALNSATEHAGNLVKLESAGDGTYYVMTGKDNYLGELTSSVTKTDVTPTAAYTFVSVDEENGLWALANGDRYLNGSIKGATTLGNATTWTVYEAVLNSEEDLSASQRMTFQEKMFASDTPCLARFFSKRNTARYLTSQESGVAIGAVLESKTEYSQIWVITSKSDGA